MAFERQRTKPAARGCGENLRRDGIIDALLIFHGGLSLAKQKAVGTEHGVAELRPRGRPGLPCQVFSAHCVQTRSSASRRVLVVNAATIDSTVSRSTDVRVRAVDRARHHRVRPSLQTLASLLACCFTNGAFSRNSACVATVVLGRAPVMSLGCGKSKTLRISSSPSGRSRLSGR